MPRRGRKRNRADQMMEEEAQSNQRNPLEDPDVLAAQEGEFEEGEDEIAQGIADRDVDEDIEDLSESDPGDLMEVGGGAPMMQPDGTIARPHRPPGRATRVPLWRYAHLSKATPQLRVWREVNGINQDVGLIASGCTTEEFIAHFLPSMPKPGEGATLFVARPVDTRGNLVAEEFEVLRLDGNHATLRSIRAGAEAPPGTPGHPQYQAPPPQLDAVQLLQVIQGAVAQATAPMSDLLRHAQEEARAAREAYNQQLRQGADERTEMAARLGGSVQDISEKMLQRGAEQAAAHAKQTTDFFVAMQGLSQADRERERDRVERERKDAAEKRREEERDAEERRRRERADDDARRERDRKDADERAERERREYQRKIDEERALADRRAQEEERRYQLRLEEDNRRHQREREENAAREREREAERARQHDLRLREIETSAQRDREHAERMIAMQRQDSPSGAIDQLQKLAGGFGVDLKEVAKQVVDRYMNPPEPQEQTDIAGTLEGLAKGLGDAVIKPIIDLAKTVKQAEAMKAQANQGVPPALIGEARGGQGSGGGQAGGQTPTNPTPSAATVAAQNGTQNPADTFPLATQKACREALRGAVQQMRQQPEENWEPIVIAAYSNEPGLYQWFKALSISGALRDVQAPQDLIEKIMAHPALKNPMLADLK